MGIKKNQLSQVVGGSGGPSAIHTQIFTVAGPGTQTIVTAPAVGKLRIVQNNEAIVFNDSIGAIDWRMTIGALEFERGVALSSVSSVNNSVSYFVQNGESLVFEILSGTSAVVSVSYYDVDTAQVGMARNSTVTDTFSVLVPDPVTVGVTRQIYLPTLLPPSAYPSLFANNLDNITHTFRFRLNDGVTPLEFNRPGTYSQYGTFSASTLVANLIAGQTLEVATVEPINSVSPLAFAAWRDIPTIL